MLSPSALAHSSLFAFCSRSFPFLPPHIRSFLHPALLCLLPALDGRAGPMGCKLQLAAVCSMHPVPHSSMAQVKGQHEQHLCGQEAMNSFWDWVIGRVQEEAGGVRRADFGEKAVCTGLRLELSSHSS